MGLSDGPSTYLFTMYNNFIYVYNEINKLDHCLILENDFDIHIFNIIHVTIQVWLLLKVQHLTKQIRYI